MKRISYILPLLFFLTACSDESAFLTETMSEEQQSLLGKAVDFSASFPEAFDTRVTYNHDGDKFNEGDLMTIYRQYWNAREGKWESVQSYRTYSFDVTYATGTSISLKTDWKVREGKWKSDEWVSTSSPGNEVAQSKADSLTWDNGETVRFRAWSRSNVANNIPSGEAGRYYPDYCVANWVTVSGPTMSIPLTLRHICSRIAFITYPGNEFYSGEICLDKRDYMYEDNSDSYENDKADKMTEAEAEAAIAEVRAAYNRMCLPASVDIETGLLTAMTNSLYMNLSDTNGFNNIEQKKKSDGIVSIGEMTSDQIASGVKHPTFSGVDGRLYLITIPYDMSSGQTQGDPIVLPPCTRFKIKLRDVNNGDAAGTSGYEAKEHIFALSDIKKSDGSPKYPDGLTMEAGKSYRFQVGYLYDQFIVTVVEEGINWSQSPDVEGETTDQGVSAMETEPYKWWKDAINLAVDHTKDNKDYNPYFIISTREEFLEFIALVNGTAAKAMDGLVRAQRAIDNPDADLTYDNAETSKYWWYDKNATDALTTNDTVWVSRKEAEQRGYLFYRHYYPQISDKPAYSVEDYVRGPFSFYDSQIDLHMVVQLANDLDLVDWSLEAIGNNVNYPFKGFFDGGAHTLSNVNMIGGYLFGYLEDGEIRDLRLSSTHNLSLLKEGRATSNSQSLRIVGLSLEADCGTNPIAEKLIGRSYVVGVIHEGDAGGALVGEASDMTMLGCMHAATNIKGAALLGNYAESSPQFLAPQRGTLKWGQFMCNYYINGPGQKTTKAVANIPDAYRPQEYIRGAQPNVLKAKNDNLLADDVPYALLSDKQKEQFYGLAPWKAMNYAIAQYNLLDVAKNSEYQSLPENHKCMMHFEVDSYGYQHMYPKLVQGETSLEGMKNILYLNN